MRAEHYGIRGCRPSMSLSSKKESAVSGVGDAGSTFFFFTTIYHQPSSFHQATPIVEKTAILISEAIKPIFHQVDCFA
jgi:hypothetical protein